MRDALSVTSMGQASAALSATAGQHLTAVLGGHSLAEAVLLGALTLLGLIGTEHCMTPPLNKIGVQRIAELLCRTYSTAGMIHPTLQYSFQRRTNGATDIIHIKCYYVKVNSSYFLTLLFLQNIFFLPKRVN
jgi:hypothetical protein